MSITNLTNDVPFGELHDDGHILCIHGPVWKTALGIVVFLSTNYVAHAATVKSSPGDGLSASICNMVLALFFPMSGLMRAMNTIARHKKWGGSDLENACRAGALCMVVRKPGWKPIEGQSFSATFLHETWYDPAEARGMNITLDDLRPSNDGEELKITAKMYSPVYAREDSTMWAYFDTIGARARVDLNTKKLHGTYTLPSGYEFAIVPRNTCLRQTRFAPPELGLVVQNEESNDSEVRSGEGIASSYSIAKALASLVQTLAALTTLLGHRKDLITQWGFASFHLTVIPYLAMTILNFASNICTADYDSLYMVETPIMQEARSRKGVFTGTVAATYDLGSATETLKAELSEWNGFSEDHVRTVAAVLLVSRSQSTRFMIWARKTLLSASKTLKHATKITPIEVTTLPIARQGLHPDSTHYNYQCDPAVHETTFAGPFQSGERTPVQEITAEAQSLNDRTSHETEISLIAPHNFEEDQDGENSSDHESKAAALVSHTCDQGLQGTLINLQAPDGAVYKTRFLSAPRSEWQSMLRTTIEAIRPVGIFSKLFTWHETFNDLLEQALRVWQVEGHAVKPFRERLIAGFTMWPGMLRQILFGKDTICYACVQEAEQKRTTITVYVPICQRFVRADDLRTATERALLAALPIHIDPAKLEARLSGRRKRSNIRGLIGEIALGLVAIGAVITLIAWQSNWFDAGLSSQTEKVIMLLWICEGTIGLIFPLISLKEVILVFIMFPLYVAILSSSSLLYLGGVTQQYGVYWVVLVFAITLIPLGTFVAPIWGFVIVGQMIATWGQCVTLF